MPPPAACRSRRQQGGEDPEEEREAGIHKVVRGHLHEHDEHDHDEQHLGDGPAFCLGMVPETARLQGEGQHQPGVEEEERQPAAQQERHVYGLGVGKGQAGREIGAKAGGQVLRDHREELRSPYGDAEVKVLGQVRDLLDRGLETELLLIAIGQDRSERGPEEHDEPGDAGHPLFARSGGNR